MDDNIFRLQQLLIEYPELHASAVLELWVTEMKEAHEKQLASMQAFRASDDSTAFYSIAELKRHEHDAAESIERYHAVKPSDLPVWSKINSIRPSDAIAIATGEVYRVGNFIQGSMRRGAIGKRYEHAPKTGSSGEVRDESASKRAV